MCVCDSVCACVSNSESVCVCVHVLSIKHDLHIHYSRGALCVVVCMQTALPEPVQSGIAGQEIVWFLSFRSGMHLHS